MRNRISGYFSQDENGKQGILDKEKIKEDAKNVVDTADSFVVMGVIKRNQGVGVSFVSGALDTLGIITIMHCFMQHLIKKIMGGGGDGHMPGM
jgi:hypothetical protein